jgi:hypothetical protein
MVGLATMTPAAGSTNDSTDLKGRDAAPCFLLRDWTGGWKATPDSRTIYIRVSLQDIYQIDLAVDYPLLQLPYATLVDISTDHLICSPIDLQLLVADHAGNSQRLAISKLTRLTPAQTAALPPKMRPGY